MTSEDQDILAKISQLAGQINRHKNGTPVTGSRTTQQPHNQATTGTNNYGRPSQPYCAPRSSSRGGYAAARYARGGRQSQVHRNRTLVLNANSKTSPNMESADDVSEEGELPSAKRVKAGASFVARTDRHMQLINTDVYQKEAQNRAKAIAESRQQKLQQKDQREKEKLKRHLQRVGERQNSSGAIASRKVDTTANYQITIEDIPFRVVKNGSKLVKLPGNPRPPNATPKTTLIGGVRFHRSKNGNMYRAGIVKAHRRNAVVQKINEPCKTFTLTGTCAKGPKCPYNHDPSKVAACKDFLLKGSCPSGDSCDLSHDLTPERTPSCLHFAKGNCSNPNCRYSHVRVSPTAPVCRPFAIYGYCEKGSTCEDRHVHECPDFSNTGTCNTKGCKLPHRHKANVMRKNPLRTDSTEESSDLSSDEEGEEIGSDDVDSDDLDEEFLGDDANGDHDILMEQDYLQLS